ncbi:GNAT family N-acetyltransferase [Levilactobacillus tujiorum]|uniref:GNAT family N-acetyltransferase n=1 Tax=Levilactobacillus tujiorum TaxID=2912243 RepID=UPI00145788D6|nr:GNAT family N-acetyltransferase [Levilactobacillus tujiorum]NLR32061.1 GNAT family N-acetyltransferase [Levilactobacillus tujiorum]
MSLIYLRRAQTPDIAKIMTIIADAKALLKADGSPQWQDGYPNEATIRQDILAQQSWVLIVDGQVAGTAAQVIGDDANYHQITGTGWQNTTDPYATIHRIALSRDYTGQHLSHYFFTTLISNAYRDGIRNFRIDTHQLNQRMQAIVTSLGYQFRGIVHVAEPGDNARRAYELNLVG